MDTSERIQILRQSGHSALDVAAILGVGYEEIKQYAADPSDVPVISGGGGGGAEPVIYAKYVFDFQDPDFVPSDGFAPLSYEDAQENQSVMVGAEVDEGDATKLWLPPGVYNYAAWYSVDTVNTTGTYLGFAMNFNYDEGDGLAPEQLSVQSGDGSFSGDGAAIALATYMNRDHWGIAEMPVYLQVNFQHDYTDLSGGGGFTLARVAGL